MKKTALITCWIPLLFSSLVAQESLTIQATDLYSFDFSEDAKVFFALTKTVGKMVYEEGLDVSTLSRNERTALSEYSEITESIYSHSSGCSWYCGANYKTVTSSVLSPSSVADYSTDNLLDFDYSTAWVEGVVGNGEGESITITFPANHPRINKVFIANGYVKSKKLWTENGRVQSLNMFVNDQLFATLKVNDSYGLQSIKLPELIGNDQPLSQTATPWTIRFEITSVYPGSKYTDTAISELYFDGIDLH